MDVDHHGTLFRAEPRCQYIQNQTILAVMLLFEAELFFVAARKIIADGRFEQVAAILNCTRAGLGRVANTGPFCRPGGWLKTRVSFGCATVRYALEDAHAL